MKKYLILLTFFILSCHKSPEENGCENFIHGSPKIQLVNARELDTIKYLMNKSNIDYSNLQFSQYSNIGFIYITSFQYVNGLKVFTDNISFSQTKSDSLLHLSGDIIKNINAPNSPMMIPIEIKKLFLDTLTKDQILKNAGIKIDTCVDLEFGYYNLNLHQITLPKNFVPAWKVTPQNNMYPQAYINDQNGNILDYFNGIYGNDKK